MTEHGALLCEGDLELRPFEPADAELLQALLAEPEVKRWRPDGDYDGENGWIVEVGGEFAGWVQYVEEDYEYYPSVALDIALTTALYAELLGVSFAVSRRRGSCEQLRSLVTTPDRS